MSFETLKHNFYKTILSIVFYIYIYCRKFNVEFKKLIKIVGHCARLKTIMMLNTPTFANNFDFIWIFSYSYLSSH